MTSDTIILDTPRHIEITISADVEVSDCALLQKDNGFYEVVPCDAEHTDGKTVASEEAVSELVSIVAALEDDDARRWALPCLRSCLLYSPVDEYGFIEAGRDIYSAIITEGYGDAAASKESEVWSDAPGLLGKIDGKFIPHPILANRAARGDVVALGILRIYWLGQPFC